MFENIYFILKYSQNIIDLIYQIDPNAIDFDYEESKTKYYPNIANILKITKTVDSIIYFLDDIDKKILFFEMLMNSVFIFEDFIPQKKQLFLKAINLVDNLKQKFDNIASYRKLSKEESNSGNNGVLQVLTNTIISIANKECFNTDQFDIVDNLLQGKIIIIDVSGFNKQMLSFLNLSIYERLIKQTAITTYKKDVTIFIDEAQKVLDINSMPDVDICRENNFEFILSTQDRMLLDKQIGTANMEILLKNIVSQYSFKTTSIQNTPIDTTKLGKFEYIDIKNKKKYITNPIFIDTDDIFDTEYKYQKLIDAFKLVNIDTNEQFILKYSQDIYDEYKALIYFKATKQNKIVDIWFDPSALDKLRNELDNDIFYLDFPVNARNLKNMMNNMAQFNIKG